MSAYNIASERDVSTRLAKFGQENEDSPARAAEKQRWSAEQAAEEAEAARQEAQAKKAGPEGSCPYMLALMAQEGGRPTGETMASVRAQRVWDWCSDHPGATAVQRRGANPDR